jgi:hypothetical protein
MGKRCSLLLVSALSATMLLAGCQNRRAGNPAQTAAPSAESTHAGGGVAPSPFSAGTLVAAFSNAGLSARVRPSTGESIFGPGADRRTLSIGKATVQLFVFADASVARKAAAGVSADGTSISRVSRSGSVEGLALYEFKGLPHLYTHGRVIALFVESGGRSVGQPLAEQDKRVIEVLESTMGLQFAGS